MDGGWSGWQRKKVDTVLLLFVNSVQIQEVCVRVWLSDSDQISISSEYHVTDSNNQKMMECKGKGEKERKNPFYCRNTLIF